MRTGIKKRRKILKKRAQKTSFTPRGQPTRFETIELGETAPEEAERKLEFEAKASMAPRGIEAEEAERKSEFEERASVAPGGIKVVGTGVTSSPALKTASETTEEYTGEQEIETKKRRVIIS